MATEFVTHSCPAGEPSGPATLKAMMRELWSYGYFVPTIFRLADGEMVARFCLSDTATELATEMWMEGR